MAKLREEREKYYVNYYYWDVIIQFCKFFRYQ